MIRSPVVFASAEKVEFANSIVENFDHTDGRVVDVSEVMRAQYPYEALWNESEGASHVVIASTVTDPDLLRRSVSEEHKSDMRAFNEMIPTWLSMIARDRGIPAVFLSSVWVFGNNGYRAGCNATPKPTSFFGRSLYMGERIVLQMDRRNTVLRLPWMFGREFPRSTPVQVMESGEVRVDGAGVAYRRAALETTQRGMIAYAPTVATAIGNYHLNYGAHNVYPYKDTSTYTWYEWVERWLPEHKKEHSYSHAGGHQKNSTFEPCPNGMIMAEDVGGDAKRFVDSYG